MNYIFNELDTIFELIHANFIVRNVQRHILISTAIKTLTLRNILDIRGQMCEFYYLGPLTYH
jgi:hypothetical protein